MTLEQSEVEAQALALLEALLRFGRDLKKAQALWDGGARIPEAAQREVRERLRSVDLVLAQLEAELP